MKKYIGLLSIIYIIAIVIRLKDTQKSFERYKEEFKEMKVQLETVSQRTNPFLMMKFTNFVFYFFLILYYVANILLFEKYLLIDIISYLLIFVGIIKLKQKLGINSVADFRQVAKTDRQQYHKQKKIDFYLGLLEFGYAFNALSLISFYY